MSVFINLSNHRSDKWGDAQLSAARTYGEIIDIPFPMISPSANNEEIDALVREYLDKLSDIDISAVMLQGEYVFVYRLVSALKSKGITVLSACSERKVMEHFDRDGRTQRESIFDFVQFREY